MFIKMPSTFPQDKFQEFGKYATERLPKLLSDEYLADRHQRRQHFDRAWMAVCYRYRACSECNEEFKALLLNASDLWSEWNDDEEQNYKLERCLYEFFVSGLSVFESFAFCLYFLGSAIRLVDFCLVCNPKRITLEGTIKAFRSAFPSAAITTRLATLPDDPGFKAIHAVRNILAHRLTGRRNVRDEIVVDGGASTHTRAAVWHVQGSDEEPEFDEQMVQHCLDEITTLLSLLIEAADEFAQNSRAGTAYP